MITRLEIDEFTVFASARFEFGALNIIHGENSSGKTHLIKLAYAIAASMLERPNDLQQDEPKKSNVDVTLSSKMIGVFRPDKGKVGRLVRRGPGERTARVKCEFEEIGMVSFEFRRRSERVKIESLPSAWLRQPPIYFPTRELLSIYPGFVNLYATTAISFDETWRDTCLLLGVPVARGVKKQEIANLLLPLEESIGCVAHLDNDRFYLKMKRPNATIEADLVAEGYRKISMVARLIANGSLEKKGYLFWDEPEANLNPRLVKVLAPILTELAANGVQVFIATHSLFLMREIDILSRGTTTQLGIRFFGLHPDEGGVSVEQGDTIDDSGALAVLDESLQQSDRYLKVMWNESATDGGHDDDI